MADKRRKIQAGLAALVAFSLFVWPVITRGPGRVSSVEAGAQRQIQFTRHVATLEFTVTPGPWLLGGVWEVGMTFDCRRGRPANCAPRLATSFGDNYFGWGEIAGWPGLYLVWVTDEQGTHYLVTDLTNSQFAGLVTPDDFVDLIDARNREVLAQETARDNADIIGGVTGIVVTFLLLFCPETFGTACVAAGATLSATGAIGAGTNYNNADGAAERIAMIEENLRGRFEQMLVAGQAP